MEEGPLWALLRPPEWAASLPHAPHRFWQLLTEGTCADTWREGQPDNLRGLSARGGSGTTPRPTGTGEVVQTWHRRLRELLGGNCSPKDTPGGEPALNSAGGSGTDLALSAEEC